MAITVEKILWDGGLFVLGCFVGATTINFTSVHIDTLQISENGVKQIEVVRKIRPHFVKTKDAIFKVNAFEFMHIKEGRRYKVIVKKNKLIQILEETK